MKTWQILSGLFIFLIVFNLWGADFSSPKATVETYQHALDRGEKKDIGDCFDPPALDFYVGSEPERARTKDCHITSLKKYSDVKIRSWNRKGIKPSLQKGDVEVIQMCKLDMKPERFFYSLRNVKGQWKIISHSGENSP